MNTKYIHHIYLHSPLSLCPPTSHWHPLWKRPVFTSCPLFIYFFQEYIDNPGVFRLGTSVYLNILCFNQINSPQPCYSFSITMLS
jgi:hypothetical protein